MPMTHAQADALAEDWIDAWNRRDVERVLGHYADELRFTSPKAQAICGRATLDGKPALRAYWLAALERLGSLRFTLDYAGWDAERGLLTIVYVAELGGTRARACELITFGAGGEAVRGEALYGAGL
jgi:SnoaL-like domain